MTVFDIERQRSNGDWTPVGQVHSGAVDVTLPEHVVETWLKAYPEKAEPGRYRLFGESFGQRFVDEFLVGERREWVVEKVKDDPEPAAEPEVEAKVDLGQRVADVYGEVS